MKPGAGGGPRLRRCSSAPGMVLCRWGCLPIWGAASGRASLECGMCRSMDAGSRLPSCTGSRKPTQDVMSSTTSQNSASCCRHLCAASTRHITRVWALASPQSGRTPLCFECGHRKHTHLPRMFCQWDVSKQVPPPHLWISSEEPWVDPHGVDARPTAGRQVATVPLIGMSRLQRR